MSRGRKAVVHNNSDWESVFYNSVGTYVQYINLRLSEHIKAEPLSNHIKIVGGYAFKSSQYKKRGVPVIRISDFSNEKIVLDDVVYYDESKDLERYELHEGDIVIALTGGTIAKLGIVQKGIGKLYLNQRVGKFEVLNPVEFENEYIYWIARSVQNIIKNLAWGAAIPNVSPKQIEELQFPIPDKKTQKGIIDFLNDLKENKLEEGKEYFNSGVEDFVFELQLNQLRGYELQAELTQQEDILKKLRQAFLYEAIQGKLVRQNPIEGIAEDLLSQIREQKDKLTKENKLRKEKDTLPIKSEETPYVIPDSWRWCKLGLLIDPRRGLSYGVVKPSRNDPNGVLFIKSGNIGDFVVEESIQTRITHELDQEFKRTKIKGGEILITLVGASIGRCAIVPNSLIGANVSRAVGVCTITDLIDKKYFVFGLYGSIQNLINTNSLDGSNRPVLNLETIRNITFPLPPYQEQLRIVSKLEEVMNHCDEMAQIVKQSKSENERLLKILLNEALGVTTNYNIEKDNTLKQEIRKFQTTEYSLERIKMKILEILQISPEPISATVVWNSSEYNKDIEAFYAELKRLIDIEKLVVEEKRGKESFLKLASNEN